MKTREGKGEMMRPRKGTEGTEDAPVRRRVARLGRLVPGETLASRWLASG